MKELPAQGFALLLSRVAMAGCAISLIVHALALLGFFSTAILKFEAALLFGMFPVAPIVAAAQLMPG